MTCAGGRAPRAGGFSLSCGARRGRYTQWVNRAASPLLALALLGAPACVGARGTAVTPAGEPVEAGAGRGPDPGPVPAPTAPEAPRGGLLRPDQIFEILEKSEITYAIETEPDVSSKNLAEVSDQPVPRSRPVDAYVHVKGGDGPRKVVSERPPAHVAELFGRAGEAFTKGDLQAAHDLYAEAAEKAPGYFKVYTFLGNTLHLLGRHGDAEVAFMKALELNPLDYQAFMFLGDTYHSMGRYHRAKAVLLRAYMLNKTSEAVQERLTITLAKLDLRLREHRLDPAFKLERTEQARVTMSFRGEAGMRWLALAACMACWAYEDACAGRSPVEDDPLRLSMYRECLINHAAALAVRRDGGTEALGPDEAPLLAAIEQGFLEAIIFWEVLGDVAPLVIYLLPDAVQEDIVRYIERFVIVSTRLV